MKTLEQVKHMGYLDAQESCQETGATLTQLLLAGTPDGGWDSWLIDAVGRNEVCRLFGEDPSENQEGWSESMAAKLVAYHAGAMDAVADLESEL